MSTANDAHFAERYPELGELGALADRVLAAADVNTMTDTAFSRLVDFAELGPRETKLQNVLDPEPGAGVECVECGHLVDPLEACQRLEEDGDVTYPLCRQCF